MYLCFESNTEGRLRVLRVYVSVLKCQRETKTLWWFQTNLARGCVRTYTWKKLLCSWTQATKRGEKVCEKCCESWTAPMCDAFICYVCVTEVIDLTFIHIIHTALTENSMNHIDSKHWHQPQVQRKSTTCQRVDGWLDGWMDRRTDR